MATASDSEVRRLRERNEAAKQQRANMVPAWQKVTRYLLPYSGRYFDTGSGRDRRRSYGDILDNTASWAHGVLVAGLAAGAFPQAMPWVGLRMRDPKLAAAGVGSEWLDEVAEIILATYTQANIYPALRHCVSQMSAFGPGCLVVEEHAERVLQLHRLSIGQFCLERDFDGYVSALFREFTSTVGAVVEKFGLANCSTRVRNAWEQDQHQQEVLILHVIDERKQRDPRRRDNRNMPWRSIYIDLNEPDDAPPLRVSGYPFMPVLAPRWDWEGDDTYGTSPALRALGDISGLQHKHTRLGESIDKMTRPATQGPSDVEEVQGLPGQHTRTTGAGRIELLAPTSLPIHYLWQQIQEGDHVRIARAFYADVFQAFLGDTRSGTTAREVMARMSEKLQGIGPVLNNIDHELLRPLVQMTLWFLQQRGALPPAPPDIEGKELDVELSSPLFRAMKSEQSRGTVQLLEMVAQLGMVPGWEHIRDRADVDNAADELRDTFGAPARVLKSVREVQPVREARAQAMAAQQQMAAAQQMAATTKDMSASEFRPDNALGRAGVAQ